MRLALRLGRTLEELLAGISSEELSLWMAFDDIEPLGDVRMDLGFGVVASTLANIHRDTKKRPQAFLPQDYMPLWQRQRPPPAVSLSEQIRAALKPTKRRKSRD